MFLIDICRIVIDVVSADIYCQWLRLLEAHPVRDVIKYHITGNTPYAVTLKLIRCEWAEDE